MKKIVLLIFFMTLHSHSKDDDYSKFLKVKAKETTEKTYRINKYEEIISGSIALLTGTIGYYTTDSTTLEFSYGLMQSLGVFALSNGINKVLTPNLELEHFKTSKESLKVKKEKLPTYYSRRIIDIFAKQERAQRLSRFTVSSLLAIQYFTNVAFKEASDDIEKVYLFTGSVSGLIALYSYYTRSSYENFYEQQNSQFFPIFDVDRAGVFYTLRF